MKQLPSCYNALYKIKRSFPMRKIAIILSLLLAAVMLTACAQHEPETDLSKPNMTVSFGYVDGLRYAPTFAVWVEDEAGNTATLFATSKVATGLKNRPEALPVWTGIREADAASGATPADKAKLTLNIPDEFAGKQLKIFIEANASYNYNADFPETSGDVNGQPSEIWTADMDTTQSGSVTLDMTAAGDVLGADHDLHGAQSITTPVLEGVKVEWEA
jgi:hypothetical protein